MDIPKKIQETINYAARDVARAIADEYQCHTDYSSLVRSVGFMLRASAAGSIAKYANSGSWTDRNVSGWLTRSADAGPGGLDKQALEQSIHDWWNELDDDAKFRVIMGSHPDTQFINEQVQKLMNKTESDLSKLDPRLLEIYRSKAGSAPKTKQPAQEDAEPPKAPEPQRPMPDQGGDGGQKAQPAPMQPLNNK